MPVDYLFIDMNSFFASVEQQLRPELRGVPVGIVPVETENTCCIAASYEAKRCGVGSVTNVREARALCPDIRLVLARPKLYVQVHHKILSAVETCLPIDAVASIDEMVCKLIGTERRPAEAVALARRVKQAIASRVGAYLKCSVGLAPNRLLAKVAADMQKPDGLTVIEKHELPERLFPLKLQDFPGIGPRMLRRFNLAGIATVEELFRLDVKALSAVWGSTLLGESWWRKLRGEDLPESHTHHRSVSQSHVLPPDQRNDASAKAVLMRLIDKAAARMRHTGYRAGSFTLAVQMLVGPSWHTRRTFPLCNDTTTFLDTGLDLWRFRPRGVPLKVGIILGDLVHDRNAPASLFDEDRRKESLSEALDQVRERFGTRSLYFAGMRPALDDDRNPIAFNHIPDESVPGS
jgi:DNA polymerase-4